MALPRDDEMLSLGPWPGGIHNVPAEEQVAIAALRAAVNVDIGADVIRRRKGATLTLAATRPRSLWGNGTLAFYAEGTAFKQFDGTAASTVGTVHPCNRVVYAEAGFHIYFSDGATLQRYNGLTQDVESAGVPAPYGSPALAASANGGMTAGTYQVALTYLTQDGEESGALLAGSVEVAEGQGITLTAIPQPLDPRVYSVAIYITPPNGEMLQFRVAVLVGVTSYTVGATYKLGRPLQTQFLAPLPAGQCLAYANGRLWSAAADVLYFSEPLVYGQCAPEKNLIMFPASIDLVLPLRERGLFVACGKRTYYIDGADPYKAALRAVYPAGAVQGVFVQAPPDAFDPELNLGTGDVPMWLANNGRILIGLPDGSVKEISGSKFAANRDSLPGAAMFRDQDSLKQFVASTKGGVVSGARASDSVTVTVIRNGIEVS